MVNGFYITVSNGLLTPQHRERMGTAVWEFMWCLDKVTRVDSQGMGWVLGGKPVKLSEIGLGTADDTVSRNLNKLNDEGYIKLIRTPYGLSIRVYKAKKRFYKNAVSENERNRKNAVSNRSDKNVESLRENVESNKTVTVDSNRLDINSADQGSAHAEIVEVIDLFKPVNPSFGRWYANKTQRSAILRLLTAHGPPQVKRVIALLPKTNKVPYLPIITTPAQLEDKWAALEAGLIKKKGEFEMKKPKVIFS